MEKWKDVKGYEGIYKISNEGRVESLFRQVLRKDGRWMTVRGRFLEPRYCKGYYYFVLSKNNNHKYIKRSLLVWDHFGDGRRDSHNIHVDHIDGDKSNDNIKNLQLLCCRDNTNKGFIQIGKKLPIGVYYHKRRGKYIARILDGKIRKHLGCFANHIEAGRAYQAALNQLSNGRV